MADTKRIDAENSQPGKMVLKPGNDLGPYKIESLLGQGGMGTVYKAFDPALKRYVALKVLSETLTNDQEAAARFIREAQSMANINHENVIPIYHIGDEQGTIYFSMELVEGKTLRALIQEGKLFRPDELLSITKQIVLALAAALNKQIIHRDLKPDNIILGSDERIRILDFGLTRVLKSGNTITQSGVIMGTPHYMSPEQAQGKTVDHRSDIYSLGVCLYHLVSGAPPFDADTPLSVMLKHVNDPVPPIINTQISVPKRFQRLIFKMMAKKPELRYENYDQIATELSNMATDNAFLDGSSSYQTAGTRSVAGQTGYTPQTIDQKKDSHLTAPRSGSQRTYPRGSSVGTRPLVIQPPPKSRSNLGFIVFLFFVLFVSGVFIYPYTKKKKSSVTKETPQTHTQPRSQYPSSGQKYVDTDSSSYRDWNDSDSQDNVYDQEQSSSNVSSNRSGVDRTTTTTKSTEEQFEDAVNLYYDASDDHQKRKALRALHDIQARLSRGDYYYNEAQKYIDRIHNKLSGQTESSDTGDKTTSDDQSREHPTRHPPPRHPPP